MKAQHVVSLFDGYAAGRCSFDRASIPVFKYHASEIDHYAIKVAKKNYPDICHIGDVQLLSEFGLHHLTGISKDIGVDILLGGSPCQGFSKAGRGLNFSDPRSKLFFEYVKVLGDLKPKYFILENVEMKKQWLNTISEYLDGVLPIKINSNLVSAHNRPRYYWVGELQEDGRYRTIDIPQPEDRKIFLKDILLPPEEVDEKYYLSEKSLKGFLSKTGSFGDRFEVKSIDGKAACLTTKPQGSRVTDTFIYQIPRGKNNGGAHTEKSPTITSNQWEYNNVLMIPEGTEKGFIEVKDGEAFDATRLTSKNRRGGAMKDKSNCITAGQFDFFYYYKGRLRRLTPIECERLQTLVDNYTLGVSDSQRYKMLGNGWTIDVIAHILSYIYKDYVQPRNLSQPTLFC